jgi:hypothetical protein
MVAIRAFAGSCAWSAVLLACAGERFPYPVGDHWPFFVGSQALIAN